MAIKDEIKWFKEQFAADVVPALAGTPLSFDLVSAIAFQEFRRIVEQAAPAFAARRGFAALGRRHPR
jgi:hypothetical protein